MRTLQIAFITFLGFTLLFSACSKKEKIEEKIDQTPKEKIEVEVKNAIVKKFNLTSNNTNLKITVLASECVLSNNDFKKDLSLVEKFDQTEDNGKKVLENLEKTENANVGLRYTSNPWTSSNAYTIGNNINFVKWNFPRPFDLMTLTLIHEFTHVAKYSHKTNYKKGNEKTVPYFIENVALKYVDDCVDFALKKIKRPVN